MVKHHVALILAYHIASRSFFENGIINEKEERSLIKRPPFLTIIFINGSVVDQTEGCKLRMWNPGISEKLVIFQAEIYTILLAVCIRQLIDVIGNNKNYITISRHLTWICHQVLPELGRLGETFICTSMCQITWTLMVMNKLAHWISLYTGGARFWR